MDRPRLHDRYACAQIISSTVGFAVAVHQLVPECGRRPLKAAGWAEARMETRTWGWTEHAGNPIVV